MNCSEFWTAFGALGQWACAVATLVAVIVALKPYRRNIKVELSSITYKLNDKAQTFPFVLCLYNKGFIDEIVVSIHVSSNDGNFIISEKPIDIEKCGYKRIEINNDLLTALRLVDTQNFRISVQDSAGYIYYSKSYPTKKYKKQENI